MGFLSGCNPGRGIRVSLLKLSGLRLRPQGVGIWELGVGFGPQDFETKLRVLGGWDLGFRVSNLVFPGLGDSGFGSLGSGFGHVAFSNFGLRVLGFGLEGFMCEEFGISGLAPS